MRHRVTLTKLKRESAPRAALVRSLARSLLLHEKIETTITKAKVVQPFVERLVTVGKRKDSQAQHLLYRTMHDHMIVDKLITDYAERFATREGGYTRLRRTGYRQGDGAPMAQVSFVVGPTGAKIAKKTKAKAAAKGKK